MAKKGLVLEGGAMRGLYTAGILDVMMEHGIDFDGIVGVSAGAAFGCNYKSGQAGRVIRYNKRFARDKRYCSMRSLITTGNIYNADFCYHVVPREYDIFNFAAFEANPMEYWVVCIDVDSGEPVYQRCDKGDDEFLEWIRASCSMPLVSRPVTIGGCRLLDGGLADSMPLQWFQSQGYDRNVVILTRPAGYVKEPVGHKRALRWLLRRYPVVAQALLQRHELYNAQLQYVAQQEQLGNTLVFRPDPPLTIGHTCHDPEQMQATYEQGRRHGEQRIDEVAAFLRV